jgi:hypothetical protein
MRSANHLGDRFFRDSIPIEAFACVGIFANGGSDIK